MKSYYLSHYFDPKNAAPFLLLSFLGLVIVLAIVLITAKIQVHQKLNAADYSPRTIRQIHSRHRKREYNLVERFFEMVFCSTSILMFLSLYYIIDEKIPEVSVYWQKYQDFILLIFLACSVILNGWLDRALVPLRCITADQKASIRLVSSFYIVLILLYIKFIYLDDNYDALILYFITLAVGRFIYFDFTWHDFCFYGAWCTHQSATARADGLLFRLCLLVRISHRLFAHLQRRDSEHSAGTSVHGRIHLRALIGRDCYSSFYKAVGPFIQNTFFLWI